MSNPVKAKAKDDGFMSQLTEMPKKVIGGVEDWIDNGTTPLEKQARRALVNVGLIAIAAVALYFVCKGGFDNSAMHAIPLLLAAGAGGLGIKLLFDQLGDSKSPLAQTVKKLMAVALPLLMLGAAAGLMAAPIVASGVVGMSSGYFIAGLVIIPLSFLAFKKISLPALEHQDNRQYFSK